MIKKHTVLFILIATFATPVLAIPPSHSDVAYGPHERNKLDLWLADSADEQPTPVLVCIHGGGFRRGDKSKFANNSQLLNKMLGAGISVAAINYRRTDDGANPYPIPMHDAARAVQFLRHQADTYHLDKTRMIATGGSAGGCMSMWLAFHDDLADPNSDDPVLRESTRLTAAAPYAGQSCVHLPTLLKWFEVKSLVEHPAGRPLFGITPEGEIEQTEQLDALTRDASPITHLTKDDPPVFMGYPANQPVDENTEFRVWVHHPILGFKLKEAMDALGIESYVLFEGGPATDPYANQFEFIISKLLSSK